MADVPKTFNEIIEIAKKKGPVGVVVAEAQDDAALKGLLDAEEKGIAIPILVGDAGKIGSTLESIGKKFKNATIVDQRTSKQSVLT